MKSNPSVSSRNSAPAPNKRNESSLESHQARSLCASPRPDGGGLTSLAQSVVRKVEGAICASWRCRDGRPHAAHSDAISLALDPPPLTHSQLASLPMATAHATPAHRREKQNRTYSLRFPLFLFSSSITVSQTSLAKSHSFSSESLSPLFETASLSLNYLRLQDHIFTIALQNPTT